MDLKEYDSLFWIAVCSNLILIAALVLAHFNLFSSKTIFGFLILLYIPCEFGSLFFLLYKYSQILLLRRDQQLLAMREKFQNSIQEELRQETVRLDEAHKKLARKLEEYAKNPDSRRIDYENSLTNRPCPSSILLNALFLHKAKAAKDAGVQLYLNLNLTDISQENEEALLSLFSNLLDNAIQAAEKSSRPFVRLEAFTYKNLIQINVHNSTSPKKISLFKTDKKQAWKHGFGMQIITSILKDYDGLLIYDQHGQEFIQQISLHLNRKEKKIPTLAKVIRKEHLE